MAVQVFTKARPTFDGNDARGVRFQWVVFGSAKWEVIDNFSSREAAVKRANEVARFFSKIRKVRVVKGDAAAKHNWLIVVRGKGTRR